MVLAECVWIPRFKAFVSKNLQPDKPFLVNNSGNAKRMLLLILLGIIVATPRSAASQDIRFTEFNTWADVATIYNFNVRFRYDGDYGIRGFLSDPNWTLAYFRPSVRYKPRPWLALHGGAALFYSFYKEGEDLPELRPWVGLRLFWPRTTNFLISHYFRMELRAFYLAGDGDWEAVLRGRYQVQVMSPELDFGFGKGFYFLTSFEVFENLGESITEAFGDRLRYNFGIGKGISRSLRIELNYLFHKIAASEQREDFKLDDHVIRLRLFYNVN